MLMVTLSFIYLNINKNKVVVIWLSCFYFSDNSIVMKKYILYQLKIKMISKIYN